MEILDHLQVQGGSTSMPEVILQDSIKNIFS